jgi:hypothetical protein
MRKIFNPTFVKNTFYFFTNTETFRRSFVVSIIAGYISETGSFKWKINKRVVYSCTNRSNMKSEGNPRISFRIYSNIVNVHV